MSDVRVDGRVVIRSVTTWLPPEPHSLASAVRTGLLTSEEAADSGYRTLTVSRQTAAPDMAVRAARRALHAADLPAHRLTTTVHAWTWHQGHDFWSPAHYVASHVGAEQAEPLGVAQMCNGGAAAMEVAATRLLADPACDHLLVTTADRFVGPGFDRWTGDYGVLYGDGATAAVLSRSGAPAVLELLALVTDAAPAMEHMHRGDDPFSSAPMDHGAVDVRRTKKAYLSGVGKETFLRAAAEHIQRVVSRALDEAGTTPSDVALVAVPRLGGSSLRDVYLPALWPVLPVTPVDLGAATGHLGAGDALANLAAAVDDDLLAPGAIGVVLSAGAGFTWTCMVVRRPASGRHEERSRT